jgi:hypothetical protein
VEHLKGVSQGKALAFIGNIRRGWRDQPDKNTLAYYEYSKIMTVKSFVTLGYRANFKKKNLSKYTDFSFVS